MILIIDNYDSFTYNVVQQFGMFGKKIKVVKNNQITIKKISQLQCSHIVLSPGPGNPSNAGVSNRIVEHYYKMIPMLGVCLGHQVIGDVFKCKVKKSSSIFHGKTSMIYHEGKSKIYKNIPLKFNATRYHSLIIDRKNIHKDIIVNAQLDDGTIMGVEHRKYPLYGVQFHPESIVTEYGKQIIENFIKIV